MRKTTRAFALRAVLAASVSAVAMTSFAFAQDPSDDEEESSSSKDEIVVTGSRIGRGALDAPQPLQQFTGDDVILSGEPNIVDYLADVPALAGSTVPEDTTGAGLGDGGLSLLNLRDLGVARTLVLVNGRRHVGAQPGTSAVDIDTIPRLLIDNVDVVTGASSAVYGADAVSGVVNFVLKEDFEGLQIDLGGASISQGFEGYNYRGSLLAGKNFFDDRLNVYISAEYEASDEIKQGDLDHAFNDSLILEVDVDPLPPNNVDGAIDNIFLAGNLSTLSRPVGGIFTLAHDIRQNGITDGINIPFVSCPTGSAVNSNCFIIDPGFSFLFNPGSATAGGTTFAPNFGTFRDPTGTLRTTVQNGNGAPFSLFQASQLPEVDAMRFQSGATFEVASNVKAFVEGKYVRENSLDNFQPGFNDITFIQVATPVNTTLPGVNNLTSMVIPIFAAPNSNPFMPANLVSAIATNTRTTYASTSPTAAPTGSVLDQRGQTRLFFTDYGDRPQDNERTMMRFVGGFKGSADRALFVDNFNWEVGYTYGQVKDENSEFGTINIERFQYAIDVVPNTNASLGALGSPICRVKLLAANGVAGFSPSDPDISECIPGHVFGSGGLTATAPYVLDNITLTNKNTQHDVLGFVSGDLFDAWGAGPIQFSLGGEWRKESALSTSSYLAGDPRFLFANVGANLDKVDYDVKEGFFEALIPILKDVPMFQSFQVGGAVRVSDYSSIGRATTWNVNGVWEVNDEITFRGTYGVATRAPNLFELFSPRRQTFIQITDPCSQPVILGTTNPIVQANRIANCAAAGVPNTYVDPAPGTTNSGANAGNPFLLEEDSKSYTASFIYQPAWLDRFSMVIDFYNIRITDAIAAAGIQNVVNLCYDGTTLNTPFCNTFTRSPTTFEIVDFTQGSVNFAALEARGIDFAVKYGFDLADDWGKGGLVPGSINFGIRGTYNMHRTNFANVIDPTDQTELDGSVVGGVVYPKMRFLATTAWTLGKLTLSHDMDFISSVEFEEDFFFNTNSDSGLQVYRTQDRFIQHDLTAVYELNDNFTFRAGVVNLFDREGGPRIGFNDYYDLFGRRYFIGARANF